MKTAWMAVLCLGFAAAPAWSGEDGAKDVTRVRLVGPDGKPVAGAQVCLVPEKRFGSEVVSYTTSDSDGVVRFTGVDRRLKQRLDVRVDRPDLANVRLHNVTATEEVVVTVPKGRRITGIAVDPSGRPAAAWIHHRAAGSSESSGETCGEDGRFDLMGLPAGPAEIAAAPISDDGSTTDMHWILVPPETADVRLTIPGTKPDASPKRRFSVRVAGPDGTTPARVKVEYRYTAGSQSQDGGLNVFDARPEAGVVVAYAARNEKDEFLPWAPARVDVPKGGADVEIRMGEGLTVEGRVVDEKGRGLSGRRVTAVEAGRFAGESTLSWASSGPDGSFQLKGLGLDAVDVAVEETVDTPASASIRARGGERGLLFTVHRATSRHLRVVDPEGRPVAGAQYFVLRHTDDPGNASATSVVSSDTPADGTAEVPPLDPTLHLSLHVVPPRNREDLSTLEVDPWTPVSGDVTVPRGFTATLKVLDTAGRPVKARVTRIRPSDRPGTSGWIESGDGPDALGIARMRALPLGPARFVASALPPTGLFPAGSPPVEVDEKHPTAELRIPTKGVSMTVKAQGAARESHVGVLLAEPGVYLVGARPFDFAKGGEAVLEKIAPGRFTVLVLRRDGDTGDVGRIEIPEFAGGEVRVPMGPARAARVRLKGPAAATDRVATIFAGDRMLADRTAGPEGRVVFDGLPPGAYAVVGFARQGKQVLRGVAQVEAGSEADIELTPADED